MKNFLMILAMVPSLVMSVERSSDISEWSEIKVEKGYILSIDLHKNKSCSKIWTKQISEFKKMNPHIKNPNMIIVDQKIKVQNCKVLVKEVSKKIVEEIKGAVISKKVSELKELNYFAGIFVGGSVLSGMSNDTAKSGHNIGIKFGRNIKHKGNTASLGLGYLRNVSTTSDENNTLGVYKLTSHLFTLEGSYLFNQGVISIGPMITGILSPDVSLNESPQVQHFAVYAGVNSVFNISNKYQLEMNVQQRVDKLDRTNILGNVGIRINFN